MRLIFFVFICLFSCEKEYKQSQTFPCVRKDTIFGILTVDNPYLEPFTMLGAKINGNYFRVTITKTGSNKNSYIDTAFFSETPFIYVKSFKKI